MEFHAWFNPFRISSNSNFDINSYISKLPNTSPLKQHPEWIVKYSGAQTYYWLNLGIPDVRDYVIHLIMEAANSYDIDGIHLDDYFYPYPVYTSDSSGNKVKVNFPDSAEYAKYGAGFSNIDDWRRDNVNQFVASLSAAIKAAKPQLKFGISPFGIWKNSISEGGAGTNGLSSYYDLYVDSKKWIDNQWIDYILPQIYWNIGYAPADYSKLATWWSQQVSGKNVALYIGQAAYKINNGSYGTAWTNPSEIPNQINLNRQNPLIKGSALFSTTDILSNKLGIYDVLKTDLYHTYALTPNMSWKDSAKPQQPQVNSIKRNGSNNEIAWNKSSSQDVNKYLVYRFDPGENVDLNNPGKIVGEVKAESSETYTFIDTAASAKDYIYAVTAVDKLSNESSAMTVDTAIPNMLNIATNAASPQKINSNIQINASSIGRLAAEYRFSLYDGSTWKVVQDYSSATSWNWSPLSKGNYRIKVDARNTGPTNDSEASKEISFVINGLYYVAIDAGHGGEDTGAIGYSGSYEKDFNLSIALKVATKLKAHGVDVLMTRTQDSTVSLDDRTNMANDAGADVFVSIHQNSYVDTSVSPPKYPQGIETYSYPGSTAGALLASKLQSNAIKNTNAVDRGTKTANFHVVRETNMPAALIECGFITNPDEEARLITDSYKDIMAYSITCGILDYLNIGREDTDLDGRVDVRDLAAVASKYNLKQGATGWSEAADLNHDKIVDLYDLIMVSKLMK
jgi:N-acetylmuramoyl-L-alanine amidase